MRDTRELAKQDGALLKELSLEQERSKQIQQNQLQKILQFLLYGCIGGGFIIFWLQIGYISQNSYYKEDNSNLVQEYKLQNVIQNTFSDEIQDPQNIKKRYQREYYTTLTIYTSLNQILPTTLDTFVLFLFTSFNLLIVQSGVGVIQTILNAIFLIKDVLVIASFIWYEDQTGWTFKNGFSNWGYMFLRNPFFFDLMIAMLNIFVLRWTYFKIAFAGKFFFSDYWYHRLGDQKVLAAQSLAWHPFGGNNIVTQNTGLMTFLIYFGLIFVVLLPHFLTGLIFIVLGIFTFFIPTIFYFGLDKILFKRLQNTFYQAKELEKLAFSKFQSETPVQIQEKLETLTGEVRNDLSVFQTTDEKLITDFYQKVKSVVYFNQVQLYLKYIFLIYIIFYTISYGTIYAQGVHIVGLLRYMYNSPLQFSLNVLSKGITKSPRLMQAARVLASL